MLRFASSPVLGDRGEFLFFVLAVLFASEYVGRTAALFTTGSCSLALCFTFPKFAFELGSLLLFVAVGVAIAFEGERRRRISRELRRVHHNLDAAQAIADIGSWESDLNERLWWSPQTYRILGVPEGTAVSRRDFLVRVHPDDRAKVQTAVEKTVSAGGEYVVEHRIVRMIDGAVREVHQRGRILADDRLTLIGSIQDVTDIRLQERELKRAQERLALKHEVGRMGTYEWFVNEDRIEWSPEMERIYGISSENHVHTFEEWKALVHPDDLPALTADMQDAIANCWRSLDHTYRVIRPDGEMIWIYGRGRYEYDSQGNPTHMLGVNMDITGLKRASQEVERANQIMELAFEAGNSGASAWDIETHELTWTPAFRRILDIDPMAPPSPELLFSRIHAEDVGRVKSALNEVLSGRRNEFLTEFRIIADDGVRWIEQRGRAFFTPSGKPVQMVSITADITERKILRGLLPTCAQCKKIRDEKDSWLPFEDYISEHSEVRFSHGFCPECLAAWSIAEGL